MKSNITVTVTKKEVETAIKEYLKGRGWKSGKVTFKVGTRAAGQPYDEYEETYFDGAEVPVSRKKS